MDAEFKIAIEAISAPIVIIKVKQEPKFSWLKMNSSAEQFSGYSIEDFKHLDLDNFEGLTPARMIMHKELNLLCQRCYRLKAPINYDFRHQLPDSTYRWSRNTMAPLFKEEKIKHLVITSQDITGLVETQAHLGEALNKTLQGYIPICSNCKKIRHEEEWQSVERYMNDQLYYSQFSHGICPGCELEFYADVNK